MGHAVTGHKSKCRGLHGHSYDIIATVDDKVIDDHSSSSDGMVIDFGDLKQAMMNVIDANYDHGWCIWKDDPRAKLLAQANDLWQYQAHRFHLTDYIPTAENLAKVWAHELNAELVKSGIKLYQLEVFETPTSSAIYVMGED
jgi:6-pyruvoyltetrahydropterin/6-carboxytetrahydropterin synthase